MLLPYSSQASCSGRQAAALPAVVATFFLRLDAADLLMPGMLYMSIGDVLVNW